LAVNIEGANFSFSGGGHDVAKFAAFGMYTAVVGWLPTGSFGRIGRTGTEKVMAAGAAARIAVYTQYQHVTALLTEDCVGMGGGIIK
jgi:hypothetical protein